MLDIDVQIDAEVEVEIDREIEGDLMITYHPQTSQRSPMRKPIKQWSVSCHAIDVILCSLTKAIRRA